jgi:hypothetical protein
MKGKSIMPSQSFFYHFDQFQNPLDRIVKEENHRNRLEVDKLTEEIAQIPVVKHLIIVVAEIAVHLTQSAIE